MIILINVECTTAIYVYIYLHIYVCVYICIYLYMSVLVYVSDLYYTAYNTCRTE